MFMFAWAALSTRESLAFCVHIYLVDNQFCSLVLALNFELSSVYIKVIQSCVAELQLCLGAEL